MSRPGCGGCTGEWDLCLFYADEGGERCPARKRPARGASLTPIADGALLKTEDDEERGDPVKNLRRSEAEAREHIRSIAERIATDKGIPFDRALSEAVADRPDVFNRLGYGPYRLKERAL